MPNLTKFYSRLRGAHDYLRKKLLLDCVHQLRSKVARVQHDLMVKGDVVEHLHIYHPL